MKYEIHELANIIPEMAAIEFDELVKDITENGLLDPITLYQGKILDGRHRYKACMQIGLVPEFEEYEGDNPIQYVLSKNLHRRHLTVGQQSFIGLNVKDAEAVLAKERQAVGHYNAPQYENNPVVANLPQLEEQGRARGRLRIAQAKERQGTRNDLNIVVNLPQCEQGKARRNALFLNVSGHRYIRIYLYPLNTLQRHFTLFWHYWPV